MSNTFIKILREYHIPINWLTISIGKDRNWLSTAEIIDYAADQLEHAQGDEHDLIQKIASFYGEKGYDVDRVVNDLLDQLVQTVIFFSANEDFQRERDISLLAALIDMNQKNQSIQNFLERIEDIYTDYDCPCCTNGFYLRYTFFPFEQPDNERLEKMYENFKAYVHTERKRLAALE